MNFEEYAAKLKVLADKNEVDFELNKGASTAALSKAVKSLGFQPDPALVAAWRVANGSSSNLFGIKGKLEPYEFLSLTAMIQRRASLENRAPQYAGYEEPRKRDPRIGPGWFQEGWVPFGELGSLLLISDLSPSAKGKQGQIISFIHDPDQMRYVATSFEAFLNDSLKAFKARPVDLFGLD